VSGEERGGVLKTASHSFAVKSVFVCVSCFALPRAVLAARRASRGRSGLAPAAEIPRACLARCLLRLFELCCRSSSPVTSSGVLRAPSRHVPASFSHARIHLCTFVLLSSASSSVRPVCALLSCAHVYLFFVLRTFFCPWNKKRAPRFPKSWYSPSTAT